MSERPIIFSAPMVRAILAGRKTQTRRVVKPQPGIVHIEQTGLPPNVTTRFAAWDNVQAQKCYLTCPYGCIGDRLWVREAWQMRGLMLGRPAADAKFAAKSAFHYRATDAESAKPWRSEWGGWCNPLFMPREVSRLTLEITEVRVERVQDISESDAIAEGAVYADGELTCSDARLAFQKRWDTLNARRGFPWSSNALVWAITFKAIEEGVANA